MSTDNIELTVIYGIGVVISSVYIWIFRKFAPNGEKAKILRYLILMVVVFFIMVLVTLFVPSKRKLISGFTDIIVSMLMSASPLLIMVSIIAYPHASVPRQVEILTIVVQVSDMWLKQWCLLFYMTSGNNLFVSKGKRMLCLCDASYTLAFPFPGNYNDPPYK